MIKMSDKVAADCRDLITQYTGLVLTEDQLMILCSQISG